MGRKKTKPLKQTPFSLKLAELRQKKALSKETLSQQVGISVTYISLLESGERQPSRDMVLKLGQVLFSVSNTAALDDLLILAGFTPTNPEHLQLPKELLDIFEQNLAENGNSFSLYLGLVMNLIKAGQHAKAQEKIQWGFQHFNAQVQLQSLLAILELSKGDYDGAILSQQQALERFQAQTDAELPVQLSDLLLNLGSMYFLRGYDHLLQRITAEHQGHSKTAKQAKILAVTDFEIARDTLKQAVEQAPCDIYILDEYARVNFNLAYLLSPQTARPVWQETIQSYQAVLASPDKHNLGHTLLKEASVFLAHAYTKSHQFAEADLILNLTSTFCPHYWLMHYVRACYYSLRYESTPVPDPAWLDQGLKSLADAAGISDPQNRTCEEATMDPDLKTLRQLKTHAFNTLITKE